MSRGISRLGAAAASPDKVWASPVKANLFRVLGVNAIRGRTFASNETPAGENGRRGTSDPENYRAKGALLAALEAKEPHALLPTATSWDLYRGGIDLCRISW